MRKQRSPLPTGVQCDVCAVPVRLHRQVHPKLDLSKITDYIYIGTNACCGTHFDERLLRLGITADLSLEAAHLDAPRGAPYYLWLPVKDHQSPTSKQFAIGIAALREFVRNKVKVYVHCVRGHGRAPTLVAGYLIKEKGMNPREAVAYITARRPITHLTPRQWVALRTVAHKTR